jgi:ParB family chromosome partitioning protein
MVRKGLGRGLTLLLGERSNPTGSLETVEPEYGTGLLEPTGIRVIPIESIVPNPFQPRHEMDPAALEELAQSIRQHGLLEPLLVRGLEGYPHTYQLIAGERRLRAAQRADLIKVPVIVREASDQELLEIALVENIQRENLNPVEEARAYRQLMDGVVKGGVGLTQQEVAERVGKSRTVIANLVRLLDLPEYVLESIRDGRISQGHGKILAGLDNGICEDAWRFVLEKNASVRELERFITESSNPSQTVESEAKRKATRKEKASSQDDPHWKAIQEALQERLRTKIIVHPNKDNSGTIEVHFFNLEDIDRLLESLDIEL